MKIAFIITAYMDPNQLGRLITNLQNENFYFYIHIDKKVNIKPFKDKCINLKNVNFIEKRFFINWGGYSQVRSILELIKNALDSSIKYDRIIHITGCDYPLLSVDKIIEEFKKNANKNYMIGYNITDLPEKNQKKKVKRYWYFDINVKNIILKKYIIKLLNTIFFLLPIRKKDSCNGKRIYFSSDYWALTYDCVYELYNEYIKDFKIQKYFKHAFAPSELFMSTMLFNSKYKKTAELYSKQNYNGLSTLSKLHYIVYTDKIKILDERDYDQLICCNKIFARKFYTGTSDTLIEMLDRNKIKN